MARREEGGEEASSDGGEPELSRKEFTLLLVRDIGIAGILVAIVFGTMFVLVRSLVPGQVLHAAIDLVNGTLAGRVVKRLGAGPAAAGDVGGAIGFMLRKRPLPSTAGQS